MTTALLYFGGAFFTLLAIQGWKAQKEVREGKPTWNTGDTLILLINVSLTLLAIAFITEAVL